MPAINVAKTDTFEIQRQKINEIGSQIFTITQGGSDLSTGILKIGDGLRSSPSLSFITDESLGFYKNLNKLTFVKSNKELFEISESNTLSFNNFSLQKRFLTTENISVQNSGFGYDLGNYSNIPLIGGSGTSASANIEVYSQTGDIINFGDDYIPGNYENIFLVGGSGTGAKASFNVTELSGIILNSGENYISGEYTDISLIGGSGVGAKANITVEDGGTIVSVVIVFSGVGYKFSDSLSVNNLDLGGSGEEFEYFITSNVGKIENFEFIDRGIEYSINDVLSLPEGIEYSVSLSSESNIVSVSSTEGIYIGSKLEKISGEGNLEENTIVVSINEELNTIEISEIPTLSGNSLINFIPPFGTSLNKFEYQITNVNTVGEITISNGGNGYTELDELTVNPADLVSPIILQVKNIQVQKIFFDLTIDEENQLVILQGTFNIGDFITDSEENKVAEILDIVLAGNNIIGLIIESTEFLTEDIIKLQGDTQTYNISSVLNRFKFLIDSGNGFEYTPNLTFAVGNTYLFDLSDSSNAIHNFSLSTFPGGNKSPSLVENVESILSITNNKIILSSEVADIEIGMEVIVVSGQGQLEENTLVEDISPITEFDDIIDDFVIIGYEITLSSIPTVSGTGVLQFQGTEYTERVTRGENFLSISVSEDTPNLYYYCSQLTVLHSNEGGEIFNEALITIDKINVKQLGDGLLILVNQIEFLNTIFFNVEDGKIQNSTIETNAIQSIAGQISNLFSENITSNLLTTNFINSSNLLTFNSPEIYIQGNLSIGNNIQFFNSSGNITTNGILRTNQSLNVSNIINITNNTISSSSGNSLILSVPTNRVVKIDTTSALIVPSGTSFQRPGIDIVENGSIRFNTDSGQYEGYSASTNTWSSLGGVRDIDGNTYIEAEAFTGANDNTLYFYNDGNNTARLTTTHLDFRTVKRIRSANTLAPASTIWSSLTPVTTGQYIRFRNNIYEVTVSGTTGGSQNPPIHTEGAVLNGTAELTYFTTAVGNLIFEEINELQIGPLGNLPLVVNAELRLANNVISTDVEDLLLRPNAGRKVTVDAPTSLVIPVGDINQRGAPARGSIRFNTTILQFEGYDGANWSSLGGVRDVDGNTYIIPETAPGANENILYFFNDNENTLQLSKNALNFESMSRITSASNTLQLDAELISFSNFDTTLDNSGTSTFLSSTKDNFDFGLSVGLVNSHLLRLNTFGDIIVNRGFGTAFEENVKVLDNELKDFELADIKVSSADIFLIKGTTNTGSSIIYSPIDACGAKIIINAHNTTTNDKEFVEYSICDKNSDIFNSEYGNITTGVDLFTSSFDFDNQGRVRITISLSNSVQEDEEVEVTIVKTVIKK